MKGDIDHVFEVAQSFIEVATDQDVLCVILLMTTGAEGRIVTNIKGASIPMIINGQQTALPVAQAMHAIFLKTHPEIGS